MTSTEKKPCLLSINPILSDAALLKQFRDGYSSQRSVVNQVLTLDHEPFSHCIIDDFILDKNGDRFCKQLSNELHNIKMNQKNNDLYKFQQSDDLASMTLPAIEQIKQFLYVDFKDWLIQATDIRLSDKIDMTCSKYEYTDYLLCHDDDVHGTVEGRRIAFIYYLVPEDWAETDGGTLDLFDTDQHGQPYRIAKSLLAKRNRLTFFEVTHQSYHQVAEVLNEKQEARLSISGWLHGPVNMRQAIVPEPLLVMKPATEFRSDDFELIKQTITPAYLAVETQYDVQMGFQENSETKLSDFFQRDYFESIISELKSETIQWTRRGPYNKRNYDVADVTSLPSAVNNLVKLFGSEPMFTILASLTGLTSETDDVDEEDEPCEPSPKKRKSTPVAEAAAASSSSSRTPSSSVPRWHFELRRWKHTYYSLSFDTDNGEEENDDNEDDESDGSLEVMIFFNYSSDSTDEAIGGGDVVFTMKNEDETLLRVIPEDNSLNLIYREDGKVLKFNKYINHRQANSIFYEFAACYVDLDKLKIEQ